MKVLNLLYSYLFFFVTILLVSCTSNENVDIQSNEMKVDLIDVLYNDKLYSCTSQGDLKAFILDYYTSKDIVGKVSDDVNIEVVYQDGFKFTLLRGVLESSERLSPFTLILKKSAGSFQDGDVEVRSQDLNQVACAMNCINDGRSTNCQQDIITVCIKQNCTCASGNGGCSPQIVYN